MSAPAPPLSLLAEVTHRCPLACPYCSNPLELVAAAAELGTDEWRRVLDEAAALGALHVHFSGGEPLARLDLAELVAAARGAGLYTNLITSAIGLGERRLEALVTAGLDHVQISVQGVEPGRADAVAGYSGAHAAKAKAARLVVAAGLPLTVNAVVHRGNAEEIEALAALAVAWGAARVEIAHVQYHGWAAVNRAALLPTRQQAFASLAAVDRARARQAGRIAIEAVAPDLWGRRPKRCLGGWAAQTIVVAPDGLALPCHVARTIPGLLFPSVREASLADIWRTSPAFEAFRGTGWMAEPCRSCPERERDLGGCRCQAFALTGDPTAADPVCELSPHHAALRASVDADVVSGATFEPRPPAPRVSAI